MPKWVRCPVRSRGEGAASWKLESNFVWSVVIPGTARRHYFKGNGCASVATF
ncbi:hypothetical protein PGB90_009271 [Kerria lacca]